jgi:uncharacterized protein (TIGR02145 family)
LVTAITKTESGLVCNNAYTRYAWAYSACGNSTPVSLNQTTSACVTPGAPCPGTPTVTYGGQVYNTVQIGSQCWFKENLNIGTRINSSLQQTDNSTIEKYCYNDLETNCNIYGGLYQWFETMQYVTTAGIQGICPTDWHIPTDGEWCTVTQFLDPTVNCGVYGYSGTNAGGKMKSAGTRTTSRLFGGISYNCYWWSSSEVYTNEVWYRYLFYFDSNVGRNYNNGNVGYSVRCVRDF